MKRQKSNTRCCIAVLFGGLLLVGCGSMPPRYNNTPYDRSQATLNIPLDEAIAGDGSTLSVAWLETFGYCHVQQSKMRRELDALRARQRTNRMYIASIGALLGITGTLYSTFRGDAASGKVTSALALGSTITAIPAFAGSASAERINELLDRINSVDETRDQARGAADNALRAANEFDRLCRRLVLTGAAEFEITKLGCVPPDPYQAASPAPPKDQVVELQNQVDGENNRYLDAQRTLSQALVKMFSSCD